jgi:hypothetical protein
MVNLRRCNVVGLAIFGFMAGCVVGDVTPSDEPGPQLGEVQQLIGWDEEINGPSIVGAVFESAMYVPAGATEYFSVSTTGTRLGRPETITFTGGASLRPSAGNPNLVGLVLSSGDVRLKIASVRPDGPITHYTLDAQKGTDPYTRACYDAIPLEGVITRDGEHRKSPLASDPRITFVCADGGGHKCARFGYPAGVPGSTTWGIHQACMLMLRAQYCTDAQPATRSGTSIRFYDNAGVYQVTPGMQLPIMTAASWPPAVDEYYFEAAFQTGYKRAVCSARARWPLLTDSCIAAIPDCGETVDDLIDPGGAVLFVASKYNQLRLDRWRSEYGTGPDRVSTVRGYYNNDSNNFMAPWDHYVHGGTDGVMLRVPPTIVPLERLTAVSVFRGAMNSTTNATDTFVARSDDARFTVSTSFQDLGQEGYVYKYASDVPNPRTLRLYRHRNTGDRTATTAEPGEIVGDGYDPYPNLADSFIGYMVGL